MAFKGKTPNKGGKPTEKETKSKLSNIASLWRTNPDSNKNVIASGKLQLEGRDGPVQDVLLMRNDKEGNPKRPDFRLVLVEHEEVTESKQESAKGDDDIPF